MVGREGCALSVRRQCELLAVNRNRLERPGRSGVGSKDLEMARRIDEIHLRFPEFGAGARASISTARMLGEGQQAHGEPHYEGHGIGGDLQAPAHESASGRSAAVSIFVARPGSRVARRGVVRRRDLYPDGTGALPISLE